MYMPVLFFLFSLPSRPILSSPASAYISVGSLLCHSSYPNLHPDHPSVISLSIILPLTHFPHQIPHGPACLISSLPMFPLLLVAVAAATQKPQQLLL
jgi:hypothetical protein